MPIFCPLLLRQVFKILTRTWHMGHTSGVVLCFEGESKECVREREREKVRTCCSVWLRLCMDLFSTPFLGWKADWRLIAPLKWARFHGRLGIKERNKEKIEAGGGFGERDHYYVIGWLNPNKDTPPQLFFHDGARIKSHSGLNGVTAQSTGDWPSCRSKPKARRNALYTIPEEGKKKKTI